MSCQLVNFKTEESDMLILEKTKCEWTDLITQVEGSLSQTAEKQTEVREKRRPFSFYFYDEERLWKQLSSHIFPAVGQKQTRI